MGEVATMNSQNWSGQISKSGDAALPQSARFESMWSEARASVASYLSCFLPYRSMVEDCMQEVAVLAWQKAPKDRGPDEFLAYCLGCAKLVAKGAVRKQRIGKLQFLEPDVAQALADVMVTQAPTPVESDQRLSALRQCLGGLDPSQRELLEARYNRDSNDTLKSEAGRRQRTLDSIYKQLERIRTALRNCVSRHVS